MVRRGLVASQAVLVGSVAQVAPPILALLTMQPLDFGAFSLVYLIFAWGLSLQLSICSEPYVRDRPVTGHSAQEQTRFRAVSSLIGLLVGIVACGLGFVVWGTAWPAAVAAVAAAGSVIRNGARYQFAVERGLAGALRSDLVFILVFAGAIAVLAGRTSSLMMALGAWSAATVASLVLVSPPRVCRPSDVRAWKAAHGQTIGPLLRDSIVLDASAIGGAYVLLPFLTLTEFGIFRAVSNVATPIRIVTEALRPLAGRRLTARGQRTLMVVILLLGAVATVASALAIIAVDRFGIALGVINSLAPYAFETGAFVGGSLVGAVLYFQARVHASARQLWAGRLWQSSSAVLCPLIGATVSGLPGAVLGTAVATSFGAGVWWVIATRWTRGDGGGRPPARPTGQSSG